MHTLSNLDNLIYDNDKYPRFAHRVNVVRPFGQLQGILDWAKANCKPGWKWQLIDTPSDIRPGQYIFLFNDDKDYTNFLLKWG